MLWKSATLGSSRAPRPPDGEPLRRTASRPSRGASTSPGSPARVVLPPHRQHRAHPREAVEQSPRAPPGPPVRSPCPRPIRSPLTGQEPPARRSRAGAAARRRDLSRASSWPATPETGESCGGRHLGRRALRGPRLPPDSRHAGRHGLDPDFTADCRRLKQPLRLGPGAPSAASRTTGCLPPWPPCEHPRR